LDSPKDTLFVESVSLSLLNVSETPNSTTSPFPSLSSNELHSLNETQAVVAGQLSGLPNELVILLDTGATGNFVNQELVDSCHLSPSPHTSPKRLTLFDGSASSSGAITAFVQDKLNVLGNTFEIKLDITRLAGADIVLGYPWMRQHGLVLDLADGKAMIKNKTGAQRWAEKAKPTTTPLTRLVPRSLPKAVTSQPRLGAASSKPSLPRENSCPRFVTSPNSISLGRNHWTNRRVPSLSLNAVCSIELDDSPHLVQTLPSFDILEFTQQEIDDLVNIVPPSLHKWLDIFHPRKGKETLAPAREYDLKIKLKEGAELRVAPLYALTPFQLTQLKEVLDRERLAGRIRPSNSAYGSPMFFVPKPGDPTVQRMVVDYRLLNSMTTPDAYPLPLIDTIMDMLAKSKFFAKLDLVGAYQLLRMAAGYEHLTAFRTPFGMFESLVVRDGLRNAPAVFQHFLNEVFADLIGQGVIVYIDDILIHAETLAELRRLTELVLQRVRETNLYLKASKCEFERTSIKFLGFIISAEGISTNPDYVQGIADFPRPQTLRQVRRFLGMASYYRRFVSHFAKIAKPLHHLTGKDVAFEWGVGQEDAFQRIKEIMTSAPVLAHFNPSYETIVQTDASVYGWGFVISQINPTTGHEHPVAIESGSFKPAEVNYTVTEKEFLAIVMAFRRRRHLLLQVTSTVLTDHLNLTYWMEPKELSPRQSRWVDLMSGFSFKIVYRKGTQAVFPDALSRRPDYEAEELDKPLVQALPKPTPSQLESTLTHMLRALAQLGDDDDAEDNDEGEAKLLDLELVRTGLKEDSDLTPVRDLFEQAGSAEPDTSRLAGLLRRIGMEPSANIQYTQQGLLRLDNRYYIPNYKTLRPTVIRLCHDACHDRCANR
jgi:hypothetical protein